MRDDGKANRARKPGRVSVVMPHFNDRDNLDVCLTLLAQQTFPSDRTEIIVADNGSPCGIEAVRETVRGRARVIEVAERGAGPARNAGVQVSTGDALAFIDSDCRPDPRWLEEGLMVLETADFVGGRVDILVGDPERLTAAEAFETVFAFRNDRYVEEEQFTVTASMFVWRAVFDDVGPFENGVPEDIDWCERATAKGHRIRFAPKSIVGHPARRTMAELLRKSRRITSERCEAARRQGKGPLAVLLRQWAVLASIAPHAIVVMTTDRLNGVRHRAMAMAALAETRAYRFAVGHRIAFQRTQSG